MNESQQFDPNRILLAVDGSQSSKAAVYAAAQIASAIGWSLHALYVVDVTQVFEIYGDTSKELSELVDNTRNEQQMTLFEEQGTLVLAEIEGLCQKMGLLVTTEMIFGGIPDTILRTAKQYSLLALGRRGNRHEKDTQHLGSNFQHIAHHIHLPLLIGGNDTTQQKFQRILLAYDGSELSRKALTWTENLQKMFGEVIVLSVEDEHRKDHTWLESRQKEITESTLTHYEFIADQGEAGKMIASIASSRQADLILMGAYQHTQLLEWTKHSVIDNVLREVNLPVLAMK